MKLYLPYLKQLLPELVILGLNTKWSGFITKYKLLQEYLSTNEIQDDELVCFIDAYDVLPTKQINKLSDTYANFIKDHPEVKIIVGYDKVDNFIHEYLCQFIFGMIDDKRLNSGQFIGTAKNIREIVAHILNTTTHFQTDQIELTKYANQFKNQVHIDVEQDFFYVKSRPLQQVMLPMAAGSTGTAGAAGTGAAGTGAAGTAGAGAFIHANGNGLLDQFLLEEHEIKLNIIEKWLLYVENIKGVMRKVCIYDLIYVKKHLAILLQIIDKNTIIK